MTFTMPSIVHRGSYTPSILPQQKAEVDHLAARQQRGDAGAVDAGEDIGDGRKGAGDDAPAARPSTRRIAMQSFDDIGRDVALGDQLQAAACERGPPVANFMGESQISVVQMAAGTEHAPHFGEEAVDRWIAEGRFDVYDGIETGIRERKPFGVSLLEV